MKLRIKAFRNDTQAQDMVEYAVAAAVLALSAVAVMPALTGTVTNVFSMISSMMASAMN